MVDLRFPVIRLLACLNLIVICLVLAGCSVIPFYRSGAKNAQGLLLSQEGIAAFERKEYETAQKKFEQSLELNKEDSETQCYYAETLWQQDHRTQAFTVLQKALGEAIGPDSQGMICQSLGVKCLQMGEIAQAEFYAEKVIHLTPQKYEGWRIRANVLVQRGKNQAALADYQRALCYSPDNAELLREIGNLQIRMGHFDLAMATWQQIGRLSPPNNEPTEVSYGKAYCLYHLKRYQEASKHLTDAMNKAPDQTELYELLAEVHLQQGDSQRALELAHWTTQVFPSNQACHALYQRMSRLAAAPEVSHTPIKW